MNYLILIHLGGEWKGKRVNFPEGAVTIGRGGGNRVIFDELDHLMVSRQHAEIVWKENAWHLNDLGSTSGSYRNGQETSQSVLEEGDLLRFGENGPEVEVHFSTNELGSTVVISDQEAAAVDESDHSLSSLKETALFSVQAAEDGSSLRMARATVVETPSLLERSRPLETPGSISGKPSAPGIALPIASALPAESHLSPLSANRPPEKLLWAVVAIAGFLLLFCLYLAIQVSGNGKQIKTQAEKISRMEEVNAELVRKLGAVNPNAGDLEKMFQAKSEEMERRMERKTREFEQKINLILEYNPLARLRWQQMNRNR